MKTLLLFLALCLVAWQPASAAVILFTSTGTFTYDNDVVFLNLTLTTPAHLSVYTTSYASGGFAPHLELWDGTGTMQYAVSNGGAPSCVPTGPAPVRPVDLCGDAEVHQGPAVTDELAAGLYIIALSHADNYSNGFKLIEPFVQDGIAGRNFTAVSGICDGPFCDPFFLTQNTGDWALTVALERVGDTPAGSLEVNTPEPGSMSLLAGGALAFVLMLRSRKNRRPPAARRLAPPAA